MSEKQNKIPVKTPVNIFTFILGLINQVFSVFFGLFDFTYGTLQVLIRGIHKEDIRHFIINHDEMAWFQVSFIGATLFLSLMYSLGWFIVLVLLHYVLEIARGRILGQGWIRSMKKWFDELVLDFAFIALSLVLAVYMHGVPFAVGGAGYWFESVTVRIAGIARSIPRLILFEYLAKFFFVTTHKHTRIPRRVKLWIHKGSKYMTIFSLVLLFIAPWYLTLAWSDVAGRVMEQVSLKEVRYPIEEVIDDTVHGIHTNLSEIDMGQLMEASLFRAFDFGFENTSDK